MVKDMRGQDIEKGDEILLHPDTVPKLLAVIVESVSEGGLAVPANTPGLPKGAQAIQAGSLVLSCRITLNFNPTGLINCLLLRKREVIASAQAGNS